MDRFKNDEKDKAISFDFLLIYLNDAYRLLYAAYQDILRDRKTNPYEKPKEIKTWHIENVITEDLVELAENKSEAEGLNFDWVNESKDLKNKNRIDIDIIYQAGLGKSKRLGIECKHFRNKSGTLYIKDGIKRFETGYYSAKMPIAGMLGYIENETPANIVDEINNNKHIRPLVLNAYKFSYEIPNSYLSEIDRTSFPDCISNIKLYHVFLDFRGLISR